jgi:hypothetical protein
MFLEPLYLPVSVFVVHHTHARTRTSHARATHGRTTRSPARTHIPHTDTRTLAHTLIRTHTHTHASTRSPTHTSTRAPTCAPTRAQATMIAARHLDDAALARLRRPTELDPCWWLRADHFRTAVAAARPSSLADQPIALLRAVDGVGHLFLSRLTHLAFSLSCTAILCALALRACDFLWLPLLAFVALSV